jgi:hypothetical protein
MSDSEGLQRYVRISAAGTASEIEIETIAMFYCIETIHELPATLESRKWWKKPP